MIDPVSSIAAYALQREQLSMTLMKQRMQAEAAMAQMLMEAAKSIEEVAGSQGNRIDIYV